MCIKNKSKLPPIKVEKKLLINIKLFRHDGMKNYEEF